MSEIVSICPKIQEQAGQSILRRLCDGQLLEDFRLRHF